MSSIPVGTATFLFTDIEGSTRLLRELGATYGEMQARHFELMREALAAHVDGASVRLPGAMWLISSAPA